jgi:hypothetical protein
MRRRHPQEDRIEQIERSVAKLIEEMKELHRSRERRGGWNNAKVSSFYTQPTIRPP